MAQKTSLLLESCELLLFISQLLILPSFLPAMELLQLQHSSPTDKPATTPSVRCLGDNIGWHKSTDRSTVPDSCSGVRVSRRFKSTMGELSKPSLLSAQASGSSTERSEERQPSGLTRHAVLSQHVTTFPVPCLLGRQFVPLGIPTAENKVSPGQDSAVEVSQQKVFGIVAECKTSDGEVTFTFKSQVVENFLSDRKGWLRRERALLRADKHRRRHNYHRIVKKALVSVPQSQGPSCGLASPGCTSSSGIVAATGTSPARISETPEPPRWRVTHEDKDFQSLPDYSPPLNSLPGGDSLKVVWPCQPRSLGRDPHASLLHPDELQLARILLLDCATYLTSKRRIFERRLQCLRIGKEFRKTHAQGACNIDVNKASKLWTAFEKVGWLDRHWVIRFL